MSVDAIRSADLIQNNNLLMWIQIIQDYQDGVL
jgi:hypothetical protein